MLVNGAFGLCPLHLYICLSFLIYILGWLLLASIFLAKKNKKFTIIVIFIYKNILTIHFNQIFVQRTGLSLVLLLMQTKLLALTIGTSIAYL
jgi:hypothetical protein